jgi:hypothetical protein
MRLSESPLLHKQTPTTATSRGERRRIIGLTRCCMLAFLMVLSASPAAHPSNHYTDKQLDALAARIGKIYWLSSSDGRVPEFFSSPAAGAATFRPAPEDSFVIIDLAGRANKEPYYAVRFESGKVGYIRPEAFHEGLNLTILASDPRAEEKEKKEKLNIEEKERVAWIQSQPWSAPVKEAAIRRQPMPGLNTGEVKHVLGPPMRVTKLRAPSKVDEEQWFYKDGSVLIFRNGLLTNVDKLEKK